MQEFKNWQITERPGYLGKNKDEKTAFWNEKYGKGNWKLLWKLTDGGFWGFKDVFYKVYLPGYVDYFKNHLEEAEFITKKYAYGYDKDLISKKAAFNPCYLNNKPGFANQFHHVSFNIALEYYLELPFRGEKPVQVREGKPGTDQSTWPEGWKWSPGRIPAVRQDLIPVTEVYGWWAEGTIEDFYQKAKVLLVKRLVNNL